jgi:hypothetical protein
MNIADRANQLRADVHPAIRFHGWNLRTGRKAIAELFDAMQTVAAAVEWSARWRIRFAATVPRPRGRIAPSAAIEHRKDHRKRPTQGDDNPARIFESDKSCED